MYLKIKIMKKRKFTTSDKAFAFANKTVNSFLFENHGSYFTVTVYANKL